MDSPLSLPPSKRHPAEFAHYLDKNLGGAGFKNSSRGKPGWRVQSGRFRGQHKDAAINQLGDEFDAIDARSSTKLGQPTPVKPPEGIAASTATAPAPPSSPVSAPSRASLFAKAAAPAPDQRPPMLGMDGKAPTYNGLDYLAAGKRPAEELKRMEIAASTFTKPSAVPPVPKSPLKAPIGTAATAAPAKSPVKSPFLAIDPDEDEEEDW